MNAVEIEQAITDLADRPFDRDEFPYAFLRAFGNKQTTISRLRGGATNKSDLGGVLQTGNIHIKVCDEGEATATLSALKQSPATAKARAKFILATDGEDFEAEDLTSGETIACAFSDFPNHFGFFLPLAGISTVKPIRENAFDIRATSRLNRLYVELLKTNPAWSAADRRHDMNHFMARLIFCFFAEDTDIFNGTGLFTATIEQMSQRDSANTHEVISEIFRTMNTAPKDRATAGLPRWADAFPYVNGGLFSGSVEVPRFSRIARSYLLHVGNLDWQRINPDIFGSMIQAVADDEERGALGMHYTSVPNILKVLDPLFLEEGEESTRGNTALIDGIRKFAMDVRDLDIDLIDRINPFGEAYAILAKTMSEESLRQVATVIAGKKARISPEDAKVIAQRAVEFKRERGRLPSATSADPWEKHLAEGAAAFVRYKDEGRYG